MKPRSLSFSTLLIGTLSLSACTDGELVVDESVVSPATAHPVTFTAFVDDGVDPSLKPESLVITSQSAYRRHFGHSAPGVDFSREWVAYYSAGLQTSDGHQASFVSIDVTDQLALVAAQTSPGAGCESHARPEVPYVLVKFSAPSVRPQSATLTLEDSLRDCSVPTPPPGPGRM